MPVADEFDFVDLGTVGRVPDEVDEIGSAGAWMIIAASGTQVDIHVKL